MVCFLALNMVSIPLYSQGRGVGPPSSIEGPGDQRINYTGQNANQERALQWKVIAPRRRDATFTLTAPSFEHQSDSIEAHRPAKLVLTARDRKWTVTNGEETSKSGRPARVTAEKNGPGGGASVFDVTVTFVERDSSHAVSGSYRTTLKGLITAGN